MQESNDREDAYGTANLIDEIVTGVDISASLIQTQVVAIGYTPNGEQQVRARR
jgi:hypothetical protein